MAGTPKRVAGPAYLASSATDIYTPPASTMYIVIRHIHIANVDASTAYTATLYIGGTGGSSGGTEIMKAKSVPANDYIDHYCAYVMKSTDFLSGLASAGSKLVITIYGEQFVTP